MILKTTYTHVVEDMYKVACTSVKNMCGDEGKFWRKSNSSSISVVMSEVTK